MRARKEPLAQNLIQLLWFLKIIKFFPNLKNIPHDQKLRILRLTTLKDRQVRGDLIEVLKIVEGIDNISDIENFLPQLLNEGRKKGMIKYFQEDM